MDKTQRALSTFRKPYSCAQTVYAAFKDAGAESMDFMKINSGGRAENNMCGALFAAKTLAPQNMKEDIVREFEALAGDTRCKELKGVHKVPCQECVRIAASLLEKRGL